MRKDSPTGAAGAAAWLALRASALLWRTIHSPPDTIRPATTNPAHTNLAAPGECSSCAGRLIAGASSTACSLALGSGTAGPPGLASGAGELAAIGSGSLRILSSD